MQKKIDARNGAMHHLPRGLRNHPYWSAPPDRGGIDPFVLSRRKMPMYAPSRAAALMFAMDHERCIVAKDWVGDVEVSTVFLRLALPTSAGPVMFFETMAFGEDEMGQARYMTWADAREGHDEILNAMRVTANPQVVVSEQSGVH